MMVNAPRKVYWVHQRGATLGYAKKGGGLYSSKEYALKRMHDLAQRDATEVAVYEGTVTWARLKDES